MKPLSDQTTAYNAIISIEYLALSGEMNMQMYSKLVLCLKILLNHSSLLRKETKAMQCAEKAEKNKYQLK